MMRYLIFDEIHASDMEKITKYLVQNAIASSMGDIFWIKVPENLLNEIQCDHKGCAPFIITVELDKNSIKFELFVRSRRTLNCRCQGYSTRQQRDFIFNYAENMLDTLGIHT
ncbi:MAG: hypothetical protein JW882_03085 [Deltaproteobacteria bacterium]|nr:hypothetical protein [Deltaproteobacteria bacterium]